MHGTTNGTLCSSLDEQLDVGRGSARNKGSFESSNSKYMDDDDDDNDMELDAKLFEDNMVKEDDEVKAW